MLAGQVLARFNDDDPGGPGTVHPLPGIIVMLAIVWFILWDRSNAKRERREALAKQAAPAEAAKLLEKARKEYIRRLWPSGEPFVDPIDPSFGAPSQPPYIQAPYFRQGDPPGWYRNEQFTNYSYPMQHYWNGSSFSERSVPDVRAVEDKIRIHNGDLRNVEWD